MGIEWQVKKELDKVSFNFKKNNQINTYDFSNAESFNKNIEYVSGANRPSDVGECYAYDKIYLSKGSFYHRGSIYLGKNPSNI